MDSDGPQYNVQDSQIDWARPDLRQDDWIETNSLRAHQQNKTKHNNY